MAWAESKLLLAIALGVNTFIAVTVAWRGRSLSSYSPSRLWSYLSRFFKGDFLGARYQASARLDLGKHNPSYSLHQLVLFAVEVGEARCCHG